MRPLAGWAVVPLLGVVGCGGEGPAPAASWSMRDSAGVRVVESAAPRWGEGEGWRVEPEPWLDLATSGSGPDHEFFVVTDATRRSDGSIAVVEDGRSDRVRLYSAEGAFLGSTGRTGDAPGEFRRPDSVDPFRGDSLAVHDFWTSRVSVLDGSVGLGRMFRPGLSPGGRLRPLVPVDDELFVGFAYGLDGLTGVVGLYRMTLALVRFSPTGELIDTVTTVPGFEGFVNELGDMAPLFARSGHLAVGAGRVVVGSADSLAYRVYDPAGTLLARVRVPGFDLSLTPDEVEAERAASFPEAGDLPAAVREVVEVLPAPGTRPGYADLRVDPTGAVWAEVHRGVAGRLDDECWRVFSPEGEWLGTVSMPPGFEALEIGGDYVLGVSTDALDIEHVQLLALRRR